MNTPVLGTYPCLFCMKNDCMNMSLDKNGRPFLRCRWCDTMCFIKADSALEGPRRLWGVALTLEGIARRGIEAMSAKAAAAPVWAESRR